jgi:hypothetical protein
MKGFNIGVIKEECGRTLFSSGNPSGVRHIKWAAPYNFSERLVRFFCLLLFLFSGAQNHLFHLVSL